MKKIKFTAYYDYLVVNEANLFTIVLVPDEIRKVPVIIVRNPYVDEFENCGEESVVCYYLKEYEKWLENGYAVIIQHCRGRGKSSGDSNRYNICYRNGFLKKGLHGEWYVGMYKAKSHIKKNFTLDSFNILPLLDFSKAVFGENAEDFDELLKHPDIHDDFWNTRYGGIEARNATDDAKFPILFTTRFYDIYTGGIFDMWNSLNDDCKRMSAMIVSPNDHGDNSEEFKFEKGKISEAFGEDYGIHWFNYIRGAEKESPFPLGKITYYRLFENRWKVEEGDFQSLNEMKIVLGKNVVSYAYNPYDPPEFNGGLSCAFGGGRFQEMPNLRYDIITVYSEPFDKDVFVKGKMSAKLCVKSDCEDTCFYTRVSIAKEQGDFGLRDDITSLCFQSMFLVI